MIDVLKLARAEIVALQPYQHARWDPSLERLHANELPWRALNDASIAGLNRYPEPQPAALIAGLATLYGVPASQVLVARGSDEGIDLLTRAFCVAGHDAVIVCPPTFGMYAVAARIQGARVISVPLMRATGFQLDVDAIERALDRSVKMIYLCSPNNPTGNRLADADIDRVLAMCAERSLVVLDEAYVEFTAHASHARLLERYPHLVILRTLSKAHGLAGARVGAVLATPAIIQLLQKIIPPYAITQATIETAAGALGSAALAVTQSRVRALVTERARVTQQIAGCPGVTKVWHSDANFLLVEFADPGSAFALIQRAGLIVRDVRYMPGLERALRISLGSPQQNDRVAASLREMNEQ
ncbi:MAG: histidinol-phosphate transaminase [Pseudomonadales bacterium]|nr:histidinol-phosphate transaminase [Pseudomonadales bacterium]